MGSGNQSTFCFTEKLLSRASAISCRFRRLVPVTQSWSKDCKSALRAVLTFGLLICVLPNCASSSASEFNPLWPVAGQSASGADAKVLRGFQGYDSVDSHLGLDIKGKKRSQILASESGLVIYAGQKFNGFGKMVLIEHENGFSTLYAHLDEIWVKTGAPVKRGQIVGLMGRTGRASGVHLHYEIRKDKEALDPKDFFRNH